MSDIYLNTSSSVKVSRWSFLDETGESVLPDAVIMEARVTSGGTVVSENIEKGSFFSYNKGAEPLRIEALLAFRGSDTLLQSVITRLEGLKTALSCFSIVSPVFEHKSMTLEAYEYSLNAQDGAGVVYVSADFVEVKEIEAAYSTENVSSITAANAANASDVSVVKTGMTSTQTPDDGQTSAGKRSLAYILTR